MKPLLLDLFCCEGGASTGYARAGFDVVGVDIEPQARYPFPFHQGDALDVLRRLMRYEQVTFSRAGLPLLSLNINDFAAIHASPPCQAYSTITPDKSKHPELIVPTREALIATGKPYVIENVEGARWELNDPVLLCGSSFGLRVRRHRYFESNVWLTSIPCDHEAQGRPVGVYGSHGEPTEFLRPNGKRRGWKAKDEADARDAMGMDWATWHGLAEAIPPAFTEWIGHQLMESLVLISHSKRGTEK